MAYELEEQASILSGNTGIFHNLGLLKALRRCMPEEQGVCAETPITSRAYL